VRTPGRGREHYHSHPRTGEKARYALKIKISTGFSKGFLIITKNDCVIKCYKFRVSHCVKYTYIKKRIQAITGTVYGTVCIQCHVTSWGKATVEKKFPDKTTDKFSAEIIWPIGLILKRLRFST
jgi:hypothetical protein